MAWAVERRIDGDDMTGETGSFPVLSRLDWAIDFEPAEWDELTRYYQRGTGQDTWDGLRFIPMMYRLRPSALKRYRLAIDAGRQRQGDLPEAARALSSLFDHVLLGYGQGILYDLRGARRRGACKEDVGHLMSIAWMYGGNEGVHAAADCAGAELDNWDASTDGPPLSWPAGWGSDQAVWSCGIDWSATAERSAVAPDEIEMIAAWHQRVEGAVPDFVPFLARFNPMGLLTYRARYEAAMHGPLPPQYVSLLLLSVASRQTVVERALRMAKSFGVDRRHVLWTLTRPRALAPGLGGRGDIDLARVASLLEAWDEG